jgi:hypothetical protein
MVQSGKFDAIYRARENLQWATVANRRTCKTDHPSTKPGKDMEQTAPKLLLPRIGSEHEVMHPMNIHSDP